MRLSRNLAPEVRLATIMLVLAALLLPTASARAGEPPPSVQMRGTQCPVDLPTSRHVDCGFLRVPQTRPWVPGGRWIKVAVAIIRAPQPRGEPILFLMGGPDYPGIDGFSVEYFRGADYARHRDVILVDVRGVGSSVPFLGCPEIDEAAAEMFPDNYTDKGWQRANRACHNRFVDSGVDVRAYAATEAALDLVDLRLALGIEQWNVIAFSAGGSVALELMRLDAAGIRATVLDSIVSRAILQPLDFWQQGEHLVNRVLRGCAAQPDCNAAYPNLRRRFFHKVSELNTHPIEVEVALAAGGSVTWTIRGADLMVEAVYGAIHPIPAAALPGLLDSLANGRVREFYESFVLEAPFPSNDFIAEGRSWIARCRDSVAFTTAADLRRASARAPHLGTIMRDETRFYRKLCASWKVGHADPASRGYLQSAVPTILLRGEYDGAVYGREIVLQSRRLSNGQLFTFPNRGHGQLVDFDGADISCPRSITTAFLAHPDQAVDGICIEAMPHIVFSTSDDSGAELPSLRGPTGVQSVMDRLTMDNLGHLGE